MAGARYGFGLFNAVVMNDEVTQTISDEFHNLPLSGELGKLDGT